MPDVRTVTTQAVHDALALRGLEDGGGGFIRTASPTEYMGEERLRLAREVLRHLPAGASVAGIKQLVERVLPVVSGLLRPGTAAPQEEQPVQFRS
jgi:hypothetical protein